MAFVDVLQGGWGILLLLFTTLASIEYINQHLNGLVCQFFVALTVMILYKVYLISSGISNYDSMPIIIAKMLDMEKDPEQMLNASIALEELLVPNTTQKYVTLRETFIKMGGIPPLCRTVIKYPKWTEFQSHALKNLHTLICYHDVEQEMNDQEGLIEAVIEIINSHHKKEVVLQHANMLLGLLCHKSIIAQKEFIDKGALEAVNDALFSNIDQAVIAQWSLFAFLNLSCDNDKSKFTIAKLGVLKNVVSVMKFHKDHHQIQRLGIITLGYCILTTIDNLSGCLNKEFDEVVIAAISAYKDDPEIQRYGNMLLGQQTNYVKSMKMRMAEDQEDNVYDQKNND